MTEYFELPEVPEYISTDQAAKILGISKQRVYQFIEEKRLPAFRAGNVILLKEEVVKQFKPNITGRPRKKGPLWRVYRGGIAVIGKDIQVEVRDGQEERLKEKLYTIYQEQRHIFPGTIQRYIFKDKSFPTVVSILLIWKDTDMPTRQRVSGFLLRSRQNWLMYWTGMLRKSVQKRVSSIRDAGLRKSLQGGCRWSLRTRLG